MPAANKKESAKQQVFSAGFRSATKISKIAPYRKYEEENLKLALSAVKEYGESLRKASKMFSVPYVTLNRHVTGVNKTMKPGKVPKLGTLEEDLVTAVKTLADMGQGTSRKDVLHLAANTAEKAGLSPFKKGIPSQKWFSAFKRRNSLALRQPENMSTARLKMATEEVKKEFFEKLDLFYADLKQKGLSPSQIYNVDETGLCVVTKSGKVLVSKGTKNVRSLTGGERGENVTCVVTVNATGSHILPPTLIYRGKSLNLDLTEGAPEGAVFAYSEKSFIDSELFLEWFKRFIAAIPPQRPVVLFLDGHASHITVEVIDLARENGIHMLCFPPHTTNYYRPLDVGVFRPLKLSFSEECNKLMRKNKRKFLNRYDVAKVLTPAWLKAITPANIQAGFRGSGLWPFNPDAVTLPAGKKQSSDPQPVTASIPVTVETQSCSSSGLRSPLPSNSVPDEAGSNSLAETERRAEITPAPHLSPADGNVLETHNSSILRDVTNSTSPVILAIRELFTEDQATPRPRSKCVTKTRIKTADEFRDEMKKKEKAETLQEIEKKRKLEARESRKAEKKDKKKVKDAGPKIAKKRKQNARKRQKSESENSDVLDNPEPISHSESEEEDELCGVCRKSFQKDFHGEEWVQCRNCKTWFHLSCLGMSEY